MLRNTVMAIATLAPLALACERKATPTPTDSASPPTIVVVRPNLLPLIDWVASFKGKAPPARKADCFTDPDRDAGFCTGITDSPYEASVYVTWRKSDPSAFDVWFPSGVKGDVPVTCKDVRGINLRTWKWSKTIRSLCWTPAELFGGNEMRLWLNTTDGRTNLRVFSESYLKSKPDQLKTFSEEGQTIMAGP
jgi:hypothetical protein